MHHATTSCRHAFPTNYISLSFLSTVYDFSIPFCFHQINKHGYGILTTHSETWIYKHGARKQITEIAGPFSCDAVAPDLSVVATVATVVMAHHNSSWLFSSEGMTPKTKFDNILAGWFNDEIGCMQPVQALSADPYTAEVFQPTDIKNIQNVNLGVNNCSFMRSRFRGWLCLMKVVDVKRKFFADQVRNEIVVYKHLESLQGRIIPKFLGHGRLNGFLEILLLEACGGVADSATADDLVALLVEIHACDVLHSDVARRNIVRRVTGEFVLIDFGRSKIGDISEKEKEEEIAEARAQMRDL